MGGAKELLLQQQEQGWTFVDDVFACSECVAESFLRKWIRQNASWEACSYCGHSSSGSCIAAPVNDLFAMIDEGLRAEYGDPLEEYPYDSDGGGFAGPWFHSYELLYELDFDLFNNQELQNTFIDAFGDRMFCPVNPFNLSESKSFQSGWERFVHHVKHQARYFFLSDPAAQPDDDDWSDEGLSVSETPSYLGEAVRALGSIREIGTDTDLFRTRLSRWGRSYRTAREIGTVPEKYAWAANRMSPAGIAMFYAAADEDTAIAEVHDAAKCSWPTTKASVGTFRPSRPLRVIDLTGRGTVPSLFDPAKRHLREKVRMLNEFGCAIAQPVDEDSVDHIEYAPTQVITEYFRYDFTAGGKGPIDGIMYLSSRNRQHVCYVLFLDNEHCIDGEEEPPEDGELRLVLQRASKGRRSHQSWSGGCVWIQACLAALGSRALRRSHVHFARVANSRRRSRRLD